MQIKKYNNSIISDRILQIIDYHELNINSFAKILGFNRAQIIYDIVKGKAKPGWKFFSAFFNSELSDEINSDWFITGKGNMLRKNTTNSGLVLASDTVKIPVYALDAAATAILSTDLPQEELSDYISLPGLEKYTGELLAFKVKGASMSPTIKSGDIVIAEKLEKNDKIKNNYIYVVLAKDGVQTAVAIKRVVESRDGESLRMTSDNRIFPPFLLPKSDILSLWTVRLKITGDFMNPLDFDQRLSEIEWKLQNINH